MSTETDAAPFERLELCACASLELAGDETRPDAVDDRLMHGRVLCVLVLLDDDEELEP